MTAGGGAGVSGAERIDRVSSLRRVATVDPGTDPRWADLVADRATDVFHSPGWLRALATTYGFDVTAAVLLDDGGKAVAGLPYCLIEGLPMRRIAAPPFSDYCDPIADTAQDWKQISDALAAHDCMVTVRVLNNVLPVDDERFTEVNKAKWHGTDISRSLDALLASFDGSARRAIRKAEKEGVQVREATDKRDLRSFFDLHLRTRKYKYRLLAQPYTFFESLWAEFVEQGSGSLLLATHGGETIGGVFFLEWRGGLYYKFSASLADAAQLRPNDLIIWSGIQAASDKGLDRLDFGLSDWEQDGLVRYKRKYASDEKTITFLRHIPASPSGEAQQVRELLPQLTDLFTDPAVPDAVTERAGNVLYKFFA